MDALEKLSPSERIQRLQEMKKKQDKDIESLIKKAQEENKESEIETERKREKEKEDVEKVEEDENIEEIIQKEKQDEEIKHQAEYKILNQEPEKTYLPDHPENKVTDVYQTEQQQSYQPFDASREEFTKRDEFKRDYY